MPSDALQIGGFRIRNTTTPGMTRFLHGRMVSGRKIAVGFANHHFVTACQRLDCDRLGRDSMVLLNDGVGVQLAALLRWGRGFGENMNGTDFVPRFLQAARRPCRVFLVGGDRAVIARATEAISDLANCQVVGFCDGFALWHHEAGVIEEIAELRPDVLLVGLGNPLQERWILQHWQALDATVIIGVGALFEWMTGTRRRAPRLLRAARLEWAYRLAIEPRRLLRRYTLDVLTFLALVVRSEARQVRRGTPS